VQIEAFIGTNKRAFSLFISYFEYVEEEYGKHYLNLDMAQMASCTPQFQGEKKKN
jgi:hypothetical protein